MRLSTLGSLLIRSPGTEQAGTPVEIYPPAWGPKADRLLARTVIAGFALSVPLTDRPALKGRRRSNGGERSI